MVKKLIITIILDDNVVIEKDDIQYIYDYLDGFFPNNKEISHTIK